MRISQVFTSWRRLAIKETWNYTADKNAAISPNIVHSALHINKTKVSPGKLALRLDLKSLKPTSNTLCSWVPLSIPSTHVSKEK